MTERWPSVTARCIVDDFGEPIPNPEVSRRAECVENHPVLKELVRLAPHSPLGQDAIRSLLHANLPAYRIKTQDYRGATWHDLREAVVWLLACGNRKSDTPQQDAYGHFATLHEAGRLKPTKDDAVAIQIERFWHKELPDFSNLVLDTIFEALANPGFLFEGESSALVPHKILAEVVPIDDDNLADIVIGFFHSAEIATKGNALIHQLILSTISDRLGISSKAWSPVYSQAFSGAISTFMVTIQFGDEPPGVDG